MEKRKIKNFNSWNSITFKDRTKKIRANKDIKNKHFFKNIIFFKVSNLIMLNIFIQVLSFNNKERTILDKYSYITLKNKFYRKHKYIQ